MDSGLPPPGPATMGPSMPFFFFIAQAFLSHFQLGANTCTAALFSRTKLDHVACESLGTLATWASGVGREGDERPTSPSPASVTGRRHTAAGYGVARRSGVRGPRSLVYICGLAAGLAHTLIVFSFYNCLQPGGLVRHGSVGGISLRMDAVHSVPSIDQAATRE